MQLVVCVSFPFFYFYVRGCIFRHAAHVVGSKLKKSSIPKTLQVAILRRRAAPFLFFFFFLRIFLIPCLDINSTLPWQLRLHRFTAARLIITGLLTTAMNEKTQVDK